MTEDAEELASSEMEATLTLQVLRACRTCQAPHPRACGLDRDTCQVCGADSVPPEPPVTVEAHVREPA